MKVIIKDNKKIFLEIPSELWIQIENDLKSALPYEGCGLCSGIDTEVNTWFYCENEVQSENEFLIEKQLPSVFREILKKGEKLLAIIHSHTSGNARPSKKDMKLSFYPEAVHIITSFNNPDKPVSGAFIIEQSEIRVLLLIEN